MDAKKKAKTCWQSSHNSTNTLLICNEYGYLIIQQAPYKKEYYGDISCQMNIVVEQEKPKDMQHQP